MARMTLRPRIGALIRDGMERQHLSQIQLAEILDVSRSAVNSWINDRSWPLNRIAALEDVLKIRIPRTVAAGGAEPEPPADPRERQLYDVLLREIENMTPAQALAIIEDDRRRREGRRTA